MKHYTKNCSVCGSPFTTKKKTTFTCSKNCASSLPRPAHHDPERIEARFWDHVEKLENGCWVWKATQHRKEYGQFYVHNKPVAAHRFSYELHYGQVPEGFYVCHNCPDGDNPACVNYNHLFAGTPADNTHDMQNKGRNAFGEKIGNSKLQPSQVLEIRSLYASGQYGVVQLAEMFGVDFTNISAITNRKTWKHL
jgi:hypothetical protein